MTDPGGVLDLVVLVLAALTPALLYLAWVRKTERYMTEAWGPLLRAFAFGAIVATLLAALVEGILVAAGTALSNAYPGPEFIFLNGNSSLGLFFLVLVVAPFTEEALKAWGVVSRARQFRIPADGPVFGASVGLGFGFFETLLYGLAAYLLGGLVAGLALIFIRSLSSVLLHGSTTAIFGYGFAQSRFFGQRAASGRYYLLAVGMHSAFNALASVGIILTLLGVSNALADTASLIALVLAVGFAFAAIEYARSLIHASDFPGASTPHPRYRAPSGKHRNPRSSRGDSPVLRG